MFTQLTYAVYLSSHCFTVLVIIVASATADEPDSSRQSQLFLDSLAWGRVCSVESTLILQIDQVPSDGRITIPRLNNPVKAVYFRGMPDQQLELKALVHEWEIHFPSERQADSGQAIVVQLEGRPYLPKEPRVVQPGTDGRFRLAAHDAVTHGECLRYEPQPKKNTLGYWINPNDWAEWHITTDRTDTYTVEVRYGCGTGQGGSIVRLECAQQNLQWKVAATGGFQEWREIRPGKLRLEMSGNYTVALRAVDLHHDAVMDVQQIVLTPEK